MSGGTIRDVALTTNTHCMEQNVLGRFSAEHLVASPEISAGDAGMRKDGEQAKHLIQCISAACLLPSAYISSYCVRASTCKKGETHALCVEDTP